MFSRTIWCVRYCVFYLSFHGFVYWFCVCFFFFKQKMAYEMRISDWSSDVCSSDLAGSVVFPEAIMRRGARRDVAPCKIFPTRASVIRRQTCGACFGKIGRASCRERVCQYV